MKSLKDMLNEQLSKNEDELPLIESVGDVQAAVNNIAHYKNYDSARAHVIKRAKELNCTEFLPDYWLMQ